MQLNNIFMIPNLILLFVGISNGKHKWKNQECDLSYFKEFECQRDLVTGDKTLDYLSSKRPYIFKQSKSHQYSPPGCNAVKFWYFGRHGTRFPGAKDITKMQTLLPQIQDEILQGLKSCKGSLCKKDLKQIKSWDTDEGLMSSTSSYLTKQGERELSYIANRYQLRFPSIFSKNYDNETYHFQFTKSERTEHSAKFFTRGIFGQKEASKVWFPVPKKADPVLKFYDSCPKWTKEVDKNPQAKIEEETFTMSFLMNSTISRISARLGIGRQLTLDEITIMYTTCGFETAWKNGKLSAWCAPFDLEALQVMAYREDLDYYWLDGYGHESNYEQACPPINDVVEYFKATTDLTSGTVDNRKAQAYFSHSGATLKLLARLGLFNDSVPIRSDNFQDVKDNYQWRTSIIDSMATNMAFVLYECPLLKDDSRHKIGFFFQEVPTALPACDGQWYCSFNNFRSKMAPIVDSCDLTRICT